MAPPPLPPPLLSLRSHVAPRDALALALGVAAALASGVWTTRAGAAVARGLGAFASTPFDVHVLETTAHELAWLAGALLVSDALAAAAFAWAAVRHTTALRADIQRRMDDVENDSGHTGAVTTATLARQLESAETAIQLRVAPALAAAVRNCSLVVTAISLANVRGSDISTENGFNVVMLIICAIVANSASMVCVWKAVSPSLEQFHLRMFARSGLPHVRSIVALNAHELVHAGVECAIFAPRDLISVLPIVAPCALLTTLFQCAGQIFFHCGGIVAEGSTTPASAFETAAGIVLASLGVVQLGLHTLAIVKAIGVWRRLGVAPGSNIQDEDDPALIQQGPPESRTNDSRSHAADTKAVLRIAQPNLRLVFGVLLGAAVASCAFAWIAVVSAEAVVAVVTKYALFTARRDFEYLTALHSDTKALGDRLFRVCGWIAGAFGAVSFVAFRLLGDGPVDRVPALHIEAMSRQRVAWLEAPGTEEAFDAAHRRVIFGMAKLREYSIVFLLIALSTSSWALVLFVWTSENSSLTAVMTGMAALGASLDWARFQRQQRWNACSSVDAIDSVMVGVSTLAKTLVPAVAFSYGGHLVQQGHIHSPEDIIQPLAALALALVSAAVATATARPACEALRRVSNACAEVLELQRSATEPAESECRARSVGSLEFRDVCFQDPIFSNVSALRQLNATVLDGETVVFCGPPRGGHKHIVALLERFYDPASGDVLLDGTSIKAVDAAWLRGQIGLMEPDPMLFPGSVADNIAVGRGPRATQRDIEEAATRAGVHDHIHGALPRGYATRITCGSSRARSGAYERYYYSPEGDINTDVGHRKIALARVFLQDPPVLIVNGPARGASVADTKILEQGIDTLVASRNRTTIVIGHELPIVRSADRIYVLNDGVIVEQGTHAQLLAKPRGLYRSLVEGAIAG